MEPQRGARRRGDGLQPLPQPRLGGQAEEARHRLHQVNSLLEAEFVIGHKLSVMCLILTETWNLRQKLQFKDSFFFGSKNHLYTPLQSRDLI